MHLKALTLRGFKSFASATTLRFEPGITCVVGPNGSGKSNVVDALSWVMGEQGAKSLRGGKMEDVIFAGTTGRPPLGRAEVSLTIDNSDGALPIEYAEVTITRIMFRNGGSEYQINGDTCRLLDIQDLLSDSGIGREMHVIVGQGQLDSVLHADPMGRRAFIEEAAGVLKHRKRKEKALRKLDAMQANLARVQDLTDELRRQLKPLGRQAAVARRAAVIQADLRDARLRLLADDLVRLREALSSEIADEAALKERKEAAEQELRKALQREALLEDEVRRLAPRLQRAQQTWYELSQLAERVRGTVSLADARVKSATSAPPEERRGRDPEDLEREAARVREQEAELEAALEAAQHALDDTVAHRAELERELAVEERRLKDVARAIADRREGLARLHGQVNAARSRAASAQAEIDRLAAARDEARERAVTAQEEYESLKAEVDGLDAGDQELGERHDEAKRRLAEAETALTAAREAVTAAERTRAATQARHEALALGLRRKDGTGALLDAKDRLTGLLGPAAELLTVTPGYEIPLAAAFGAAADALAVTSPSAAADAIRLLRKQDAGRAALLLAGAPQEPADSTPGVAGATGGDGGDGATGAVGPTFAADLVRAPSELVPAVRRLLRGVAVVGTLEDAEDLVYARPELTAVTAEGDLLGAHFAQGGSAGAPSLLEVQASVDQAAAELEELAVRCAELAEAQRAAGDRRRECAASVEELGERRRAADREKSAVAQQLGRLAGQARGAAGEAERSAAAAARAQEALDRAVEEAEGAGRAVGRRRGDAGGGGARHLRAGPARRGRGQRTADRDGGAAPGPYARGAGQGARRAGRRAGPGRADRTRGTRACRAAPCAAAARGRCRAGRRRRRAAAARACRGVARADRAGAGRRRRGQGAAGAGAGRRPDRGARPQGGTRQADGLGPPGRGARRGEAAADRAAGDEGAGGAGRRTGGAGVRVRTAPAGAAVARRRG
ncbi:chromosome segregation protein [Streptomyces phaeoluteigriseus]